MVYFQNILKSLYDEDKCDEGCKSLLRESGKIPNEGASIGGN